MGGDDSATTAASPLLPVSHNVVTSPCTINAAAAAGTPNAAVAARAVAAAAVGMPAKPAEGSTASAVGPAAATSRRVPSPPAAITGDIILNAPSPGDASLVQPTPPAPAAAGGTLSAFSRRPAAETLAALHRAHIAALQLQEGTAAANSALRVENSALKRENNARKRESRCVCVSLTVR